MEHYWSLERLSKVIGLNRSQIKHEMADGRILPTLVCNESPVWSDEDVEKLRARYKDLPFMLNVGETVAALHACQSWFMAQVTLGNIVPDMRIGKRILFDARKIQELAAKVAKLQVSVLPKEVADVRRKAYKPMGPNHRHRLRLEAGYRSINNVAEMCGVSNASIYWHIKKGNIQPPSVFLDGNSGFFYTLEQATAIAKWFKQKPKRSRGRKPLLQKPKKK